MKEERWQFGELETGTKSDCGSEERESGLQSVCESEERDSHVVN